MKLSHGEPKKIERTPSLRVRYLVALSLVALLTLISQALIQHQLGWATIDGPLINTAGRQRMLSQRINHQARTVVLAKSRAEKAELAALLLTTLDEWQASHATLAAGGKGHDSDAHYSDELRRAYRELGPLVDETSEHVRALTRADNPAATIHHFNEVQERTEDFLRLMNHAVSLHEADYAAKVNRLQVVEIGLFVATLLLLTFEAVLVFEPAARMIVRQRVALDEKAERLRVIAGEAERASDVKSAFLANMSHEIRTPLTAVIGSAELLKAPSSDAERTDLIRAISHNAEHLLDVINDVLDLTKIEAGQLTLDEKQTSLIELVAQIDTIIRPNASAKQLKLDLRFATPVPARLLLDPTRTRQVLINLIGNAIKFTRKGGVAVTCGYEVDRPKPIVWFEVSDTGIGIPSDRVEAVFNTFEQADKSTTRKHGGTGLGLAVSRSIAHAMLGDLVVARSTPGVGTTFRFTLEPESIGPAQMVQDPTAELDALRRTTPRYPAPQPSRDGALAGRVLIAEDSPDNQKLLGYFIKRTDLEAAFVGNGQQAVQAVEDHAAQGNAFDAVLMDMQMPVMDGPTAVRAIRAAGHPVPIIAFTANVTVEDRESFFEAGCTDFLAKPVKPDDFIDAIRRAIAGEGSTSAVARAA
ncbi:MAG: ATP-binding protein [Planctomycetota bacterium]